MCNVPSRMKICESASQIVYPRASCVCLAVPDGNDDASASPRNRHEAGKRRTVLSQPLLSVCDVLRDFELQLLHFNEISQLPLQTKSLLVSELPFL